MVNMVSHSAVVFSAAESVVPVQGCAVSLQSGVCVPQPEPAREVRHGVSIYNVCDGVSMASVSL